jgi:N-acetylmuramoyl-L-alanine amidase
MKILANFFNLVAVSAITIFVGYNPSNAQVISQSDLSHITAIDRDCLAKNIYFEARGESIDGQIAVAWVTLNRLDHQYFPNSICAVVQQANRDTDGNIIRNQCQFSWFCDGRPDVIGSDDSSQRSWLYAQLIAHSVIFDWAMNEPSPVKDAIMFHASYTTPYWARRFDRVATIGNHIFYK